MVQGGAEWCWVVLGGVRVGLASSSLASRLSYAPSHFHPRPPSFILVSQASLADLEMRPTAVEIEAMLGTRVDRSELREIHETLSVRLQVIRHRPAETQSSHKYGTRMAHV